MNVSALFRALTKSREPAHSSDGGDGSLQMSRIGNLFTADWKQRLLLAGRCFNVTVGDLANGGGDVALITGGGAGTVIDSDQPELIVGVTAGYSLIPIFFHAACQVDLDADAEVGNVTLFADTTQAPPASATATSETPISLLGTGLVTSVARCYSAVTADITDPVASIMLGYKTVRAAEFISNGTATNLTNGIVVGLDLVYDPSLPVVLKGPCSVVACWGGTAAVTGAATLHWAEVPSSWVE